MMTTRSDDVSGDRANQRVRVRFFAVVARAVGEREVDVVVPCGASIGEAVQIAAKHAVDVAAFERILPACSLLVNGYYRDAKIPLSDIGSGDLEADDARLTIDVLPPFAGG